MKKIEWEYNGKSYIIYDDKEGNLYLNGYLLDCHQIFENINSLDKTLAEQIKKEAEAFLEKNDYDVELDYIEGIEPESTNKYANQHLKFSDVTFIEEHEIERLRFRFSGLESKEWEFCKKKYIAHYDPKNDVFYVNGCVCNGFSYVWHRLCSTDISVSDAAKQTVKELEIARLEKIGVRINRMELSEAELDTVEKVGVSLGLLGVIGLIILIVYIIYEIWWFFVGEWAIEGPFANNISRRDVTVETIFFFIALIVIIEEVVRRIRNGHF